MQNKILKSIHASHLGIEKTKQRAQSVIYWPGLSQSIKLYFQKCNACCTYQKMTAKELLLQHQIPQYPWEHLGIDLFYLSGKWFLVMIDYYSCHFRDVKLGTNAYSDQIIE